MAFVTAEPGSQYHNVSAGKFCHLAGWVKYCGTYNQANEANMLFDEMQFSVRDRQIARIFYKQSGRPLCQRELDIISSVFDQISMQESLRDVFRILEAITVISLVIETLKSSSDLFFTKTGVELEKQHLSALEDETRKAA